MNKNLLDYNDEKIKAVRDDIDSDLALIAEAQRRIEAARQAIAERVCPFSIEQMLVDKQGNKLLVESIYYKDFPPYYHIDGFKLKKDGNPYKNSHTVWHARYLKPA